MDYLACAAFGFVTGFGFAFEVVAVILTAKPKPAAPPAEGAGLAEDFA